jgi:hypothetical protein
MNKIIALLGGLALVGSAQAANLSVLDNVEAKMMNTEEMATTQGSDCCTQRNWLTQLLAISQNAGNVNYGDGNGVFVGQDVNTGNYADQTNYGGYWW